MRLIMFQAGEKSLRAFILTGVLLLAIICLLVFLGRQLVLPAAVVQPLAGKVIAVDPGHGGYDPGVILGDVAEKELVLQVSLKLRDYLEGGGAIVVMTREQDKDFLTETQSGPRKREDMANRMQIVKDSGAHLLVSLHANSISSSLWSGSQVFYYEGYEEGKRLAGLIQAELRAVMQNTDRWIQQGDYYMLREADIPGAIVEIGFISNPEERRLLQEDNYQQRLAWAVYRGIVRYFNGENVNIEITGA